MVGIPETPGKGRRAGMLIHLVLGMGRRGVIKETENGEQGIG